MLVSPEWKFRSRPMATLLLRDSKSKSRQQVDNRDVSNSINGQVQLSSSICIDLFPGFPIISLLRNSERIDFNGGTSLRPSN